MPFELRYAFRYLFSKRGGLARLTTCSALIGIAFGVACLIVVQAIYDGFREGVEGRLLAQTAHITVTSKEPGGAPPNLVSKSIGQDPNVAEVQPVLVRSSVVSHGEKTAYGLIRVDFPAESDRRLKRGIDVGSTLADHLGARKGDKANLLYEDAAGDAAAVEFEINGLIETGLYEYDSQLVRMSVDDYRQLSDDMKVSANAYLVSLDRPFEADKTSENLRKSLGPAYSVTDWRSANRPLFAALSFERRIGFAVFGIMVLLASLGVAATLALLVSERRFDIAVFKTCGARSRNLLKMFAIEGLMIGLGGVALGVVFGILACLVANTFGLLNLPGEVYSISRLELVPDLESTLTIAGGAFLLIIPSVLVPVFKAAKIRPAELLRTE